MFMAQDDVWVSLKLVNEFLAVCGNHSPTFEQKKFITDFLSYININTETKNIRFLSERERTCLFWIAHGKTIEEIALLMQIKTCTVQTYRHRILSKLQCRTVAQAVFLAIR
jgi:DNA-binding CsgD family transcriptional regulator